MLYSIKFVNDTPDLVHGKKSWRSYFSTTVTVFSGCSTILARGFIALEQAGVEHPVLCQFAVTIQLTGS